MRGAGAYGRALGRGAKEGEALGSRVEKTTGGQEAKAKITPRIVARLATISLLCLPSCVAVSFVGIPPSVKVGLDYDFVRRYAFDEEWKEKRMDDRLRYEDIHRQIWETRAEKRRQMGFALGGRRGE